VPHTFGNAGALVKNAMTWYDHETNSIWSQPIGQSFLGPLKGTKLQLLPFQLTTYANWVENYPETLVMVNNYDRLGGLQQGFRTTFVIGLVLADQSKAYYYEDVEAAGVINDTLGEFPVVVWAENNEFQAFIRRIGDQTLTFKLEDGQIVDLETGSIWDISRGLAKEGPLLGEGLQAVPVLSSFDWAFEDFYPDGEFYQP
jgi:hypothetical protein